MEGDTLPAQLFEAMYPANNETACGQHKFYWLYRICHLDMTATPLTEKISSSRAFYQQWSQLQAIVGQENSLCFKDAVSGLLDCMFFWNSKEGSNVQFLQRRLQQHTSASVLQHQRASVAGGPHSPSAKRLFLASARVQEFFIVKGTQPGWTLISGEI